MAGIVTLSTEAVLELLQSVAAEVITPRFRSLSSAQIDEKKPGDLVTVADHESEELITRALLGRLSRRRGPGRGGLLRACGRPGSGHPPRHLRVWGR